MKTTKTMSWVDVPTRTIDVDGVSFAYRDLGPVGGVPVVFLHHLMAVLDDWDPRIIDGIAAHHRVIAFDNRGVGASGGSVPDTVEEMGRDAIAFMRAMGLEQVDLAPVSTCSIDITRIPPSASTSGSPSWAGTSRTWTP